MITMWQVAEHSGQNSRPLVCGRRFGGLGEAHLLGPHPDALSHGANHS